MIPITWEIQMNHSAIAVSCYMIKQKYKTFCGQIMCLIRMSEKTWSDLIGWFKVKQMFKYLSQWACLWSMHIVMIKLRACYFHNLVSLLVDHVILIIIPTILARVLNILFQEFNAEIFSFIFKLNPLNQDPLVSTDPTTLGSCCPFLLSVTLIDILATWVYALSHNDRYTGQSGSKC